MTTTALALPTESLFARGRFGACVGAVTLISLLAFEQIAVATAMPAIAQALDGLALYALAFGGMLALSVLGMVLAGESCDRRGAWPSTVAGLVVFSAGLLLAGLAPGMGWLVAGRIVQGLGGGMLSVALYVGMAQVVPQRLHPKLFALFAAAWVVPGLVGPALAAWLVGQFGWRSVFLAVVLTVPLAAALLLPAIGRDAPVHEPGADAPPPRRARLGWAALAAMGALALHGVASVDAKPWALLLLVLALLATGVAARRLLPPGSLRAAPGLPSVIVLRGLLAAAFATAEVFVPLYLIREQGWSLARAGLALSVGAVAWSLGSAAQARLVAAPARRRGLQLGFVAVVVGLVVVGAQGLLGLSAWFVVFGWSITGLGIGLSFPMLSVLMLSLSAPSERGSHSSALQLSDALCSSAALAVAGALFGLAGPAGRTAYLMVLSLALTLALAGALLGPRSFGQS